MKVTATPEARELIQKRGGRVWVWLDPHAWLAGGYVWLETHCEPPGTSRETKFTRSSRRGHRFRTVDAEGFELNVDFGRLEPPDELQIEVRGLFNKRLESYWNGNWFVDAEPPAGPR